MDNQKMKMSSNVPSQFKPVAFVSQPVKKAAIAALGIAAMGGIAGLPNAAMANPSSSPQPIAFISQQQQITMGTEKLAAWENTLHQRLGLDTTNSLRSDGHHCTTCCPFADDCG
jgi:hypothetical protein